MRIWNFTALCFHLEMGRSPIVIRQMVRRRRADDQESGGDDGFECCGFCRVCTCLRWGFLATPTGVLKAIEMVGED